MHTEGQVQIPRPCLVSGKWTRMLCIPFGLQARYWGPDRASAVVGFLCSLAYWGTVGFSSPRATKEQCSTGVWAAPASPPFNTTDCVDMSSS